MRKPGRPLRGCPHPSATTCACRSVTVALPRKRKCECVLTPAPDAAAAAAHDAPAKTRRKLADAADDAAADPAHMAVSEDPGAGPREAAPRRTSEDAALPATSAFAAPPAVASCCSARAATTSYLSSVSSSASSVASPEPTVASSMTSGLNTPVPPREGDPAPASYVAAPGRPFKFPPIPADFDRPASFRPPPPGLPAAPITVQGTLVQPVGVNLPLCTGCLSQPQASVVFQLPPLAGLHIDPRAPPGSGPRVAVYVVVQPPTQLPGFPSQGWAPAPAPATPTALAPPPPPHQTVSVPTPASACGKTDLLHDCSCGPMCQCIGCISHPFNDATRQLISSVYEDQWHTRPPGPPVGSCCAPLPPVDNPATATTAAASTSAASEGTLGIEWPVDELPSFSAGPSPVLNERMDWDDRFLFIDYPLYTGQCQGDKGGCMCGPSCQCAGCVIHGNHVAVNSLGT